jgi:hypothetical protein
MLTSWLARCLLHFVGWKLFVIEAPALILLLRRLRRSKARQQTTLLTRRREIGPDWADSSTHESGSVKPLAQRKPKWLE